MRSKTAPAPRGAAAVPPTHACCARCAGREVQHPRGHLAAGALPAGGAPGVRGAHARHGHQAAPLVCGRLGCAAAAAVAPCGVARCWPRCWPHTTVQAQRAARDLLPPPCCRPGAHALHWAVALPRFQPPRDGTGAFPPCLPQAGKADAAALLLMGAGCAAAVGGRLFGWLCCGCGCAAAFGGRLFGWLCCGCGCAGGQRCIWLTANFQ